MKRSNLLGAVCVCVFALAGPTVAHAVPVSGQGTWEQTLKFRDLDGDLSTAEAWYDTTLDITWLADAGVTGRASWDFQVAWAAGLDINGVDDWRLPGLSPIGGSSTFDIAFSNNATTDVGYAPTTTDGTDGGWRNGAGDPVSEMGHMFYVTLANLGSCTPDDADPSGCVQQPGSGVLNTGPFSNLIFFVYWSGLELDADDAWYLDFGDGEQNTFEKDDSLFHWRAWAVHDGDVGVVPEPSTGLLIALGLVGIAAGRSIGGIGCVSVSTSDNG